MDVWAQMFAILPAWISPTVKSTTTKTSRTTATLRTTSLPVLHLEGAPPSTGRSCGIFNGSGLPEDAATDHVQILGRARKARSAPQPEPRRVLHANSPTTNKFSLLVTLQYNPCITSLGSLGILQFIGSAGSGSRHLFVIVGGLCLKRQTLQHRRL